MLANIQKKNKILTIVVIGCKANGSLSCVNDGKCTKNGTCECKLGHIGETCFTCKIKFSI